MTHACTFTSPANTDSRSRGHNTDTTQAQDSQSQKKPREAASGILREIRSSSAAGVRAKQRASPNLYSMEGKEGGGEFVCGCVCVCV